MNSTLQKQIFLGFVICSSFAWAEPAIEALTGSDSAKKLEAVSEAEPSSYLICKNGIVVRTLRIEKQGSKCKTTYTKEGQETVVGKSGTMDLCQNVFERIRGNLEKGGEWKCKDITKSRVSSAE